MKKICQVILCALFAIGGYCQEKRADSLDKEERRSNIYANRKYGISISWMPYANVSHGNNINTFGALDINFSNRVTWLDIGNNGSLETNIGMGFEPYQGTKLHLGFDYELLSKRYKAHLYIGGQYSLGLAQANTLNDYSFVKLGFHHYLMPFVGVMWWPGKEDITALEAEKKYLYQHPRFRQLFFFKFQVGYSCLLGKLQVDTTGVFSDHLYQVIRSNTSNTLNIKFAVGLNIPTSGRKREKYFHLLESRQMKIE